MCLYSPQRRMVWSHGLIAVQNMRNARRGKHLYRLKIQSRHYSHPPRDIRPSASNRRQPPNALECSFQKSGEAIRLS